MVKENGKGHSSKSVVILNSYPIEKPSKTSALSGNHAHLTLTFCRYPGTSRTIGMQRSTTMGPSFKDPLHHHAAAGMEILAGQPTRLFAYDKGNDIRDVLRRAESFEW